MSFTQKVTLTYYFTLDIRSCFGKVNVVLIGVALLTETDALDGISLPSLFFYSRSFRHHQFLVALRSGAISRREGDVMMELLQSSETRRLTNGRRGCPRLGWLHLSVPSPNRARKVVSSTDRHSSSLEAPKVDKHSRAANSTRERRMYCNCRVVQRISRLDHSCRPLYLVRTWRFAPSNGLCL